MSKVYLAPAGSLWLILEEGRSALLASGSVPAKALNLETGEVRVFHRSLSDLVRYGWCEL